MPAALAALPILAILVLMLGLRWSAVAAGVTGAIAALAIGIGVFSFPAATAPAATVAAGLGGTLAEAGFTALTILWIIGPALGIHQLQLETGAASVLRDALAAFAPDPRLLALLVAWFFVLFMEGAAGFGASVALAAPFLVAAGFRAVDAVTIALVGHVVGVSFGAVGTPILPQMAVTGATGLELARASGIYHSLLGWLPLAVMAVLVQRSTTTDHTGARSSGSPGAAEPPGATPLKSTSHGPNMLVWTLAAFVCFVVPYTLLWAFVGPELPTLGGALFGGIAFVVLLRTFAPRNTTAAATGRPAAAAVVRAAAPYLVLVLVVLITRLLPPLRTALQAIVLEWQLHDAFSGSIQLFYHPGTVLLAGFVAGALLQRGTRAQLRNAVVGATLRLVPVAVALVAMLTLSRAMVHAGMTETLALAAAAAAGGAWPLFAPFVGTLGTFVTGSATASNILFTDLQQETALALGLPVTGVAGAQNFGAAVGNMICPHNVIAAGATVGLARREGEILRRTLPVTLAYAGLGGLLALLLVG